MDKRRIPANESVAAIELRGRVDAPRYVEGVARQIQAPLAELLDAPDGKRERQLVRGEGVRVLDEVAGHAFVQAERDSHVGYVRVEHIGPRVTPSHRVCVRQTHAYPTPNFKDRESLSLPFAARLRVEGQEGRFMQTDAGYVPAAHLAPLDMLAADPVAVAEVFLGTPYLWGGNSGWGIDCSGLVQAAMLASGVPCPGDSDMQEAELGLPLSPDASVQRGDCLFWKGHVAIVVDDERLIHANAHTMSVAYEPLDVAIERIRAQGEGEVTSRRRPVLPV